MYLPLNSYFVFFFFLVVSDGMESFDTGGGAADYGDDDAYDDDDEERVSKLFCMKLLTCWNKSQDYEIQVWYYRCPRNKLKSFIFYIIK